jgi:hypothetical protein
MILAVHPLQASLRMVANLNNQIPHGNEVTGCDLG